MSSGTVGPERSSHKRIVSAEAVCVVTSRICVYVMYQRQGSRARPLKLPPLIEETTPPEETSHRASQEKKLRDWVEPRRTLDHSLGVASTRRRQDDDTAERTQAQHGRSSKMSMNIWLRSSSGSRRIGER